MTDPPAGAGKCKGLAYSLRLALNLTGYNGHEIATHLTAEELEQLDLPANLSSISEFGTGEMIWRGCLDNCIAIWKFTNDYHWKIPQTEGCIDVRFAVYSKTELPTGFVILNKAETCDRRAFKQYVSIGSLAGVGTKIFSN